MRPLAALAPNPNRLRPADHLFRAVTADAFRHFAMTGGDEGALRDLYGAQGAEASLPVLRATVSPATTGGAGWAAEVTGPVLADFVSGLVPISAAAALFARTGTLNWAEANNLAMPSIATGATASSIKELEPVPVTAPTFANAQMFPRKLACMAVLTANCSGAAMPRPRSGWR